MLFGMLWLASLFLALTSFQYLSDLEVTPLSFDAEVFRDAFNKSQDRGRLVMVMSPT